MGKMKSRNKNTWIVWVIISTYPVEKKKDKKEQILLFKLHFDTMF